MKTVIVDGVEMNISSDDGSPEELAPWYEQFLKLPEGKREIITNRIMRLIKEKKPDTFEFIKNFKCKLVGVTPRIVYTLADSSDGESLDVSWIHSFSMTTLLFWCDQGQFGFFVNPNLDFNETVLNKVKGNPKTSLKGFTG